MNADELMIELKNSAQSMGYESADSREYVDHTQSLREEIMQMDAATLVAYYAEVPQDLAAILQDATPTHSKDWATPYLREVCRVCGEISMKELRDLYLDGEWCNDVHHLTPSLAELFSADPELGKALQVIWDGDMSRDETPARNLLTICVFLLACDRKKKKK